MAGPGNWTIYNDYLLAESSGGVDLATDSFKLALFTSASSAINKAVVGANYTAFASDGHEVANGNGYTTGGVPVAAPLLVGGGASSTVFSAGGVSWSATGSGFVARAAVLYDATAAGLPAVAYFLLDSTPANVSCTVGNPLFVTVGNVFTKSSS